MSIDAKYVAKSKADLSNIASQDPAIIMTEDEVKLVVKSPQNPSNNSAFLSYDYFR